MQELYQTMVLYLVDVPADEAKRILTPAPSGFVVTRKLARQFEGCWARRTYPRG
jgi:hypothetical protein